MIKRQTYKPQECKHIFARSTVFKKTIYCPTCEKNIVSRRGLVRKRQ